MKTNAAIVAFVACALLAACAGDSVLDRSRTLLGEGRADAALAVLEQASREQPENRAYRAAYFKERDRLFIQWLAQARALESNGVLDPAEALYRQVLRYDTTQPRASIGLARIEAEKRHRELIAQAESLAKAQKDDEAQALLATVLAENPRQREARRLARQLDERSAKSAIAPLRLKSPVNRPLTLELRDVDLRTAFEVLSRSTGLTFLFDKDVHTETRTSLVVRDAQVEDAIRMILATQQLEYKVANETTALVFPNTQQKLREYQELVVKSFYVTNADVRQTANMLRTILKTRDVFVDEKLGLLVVKDTPSGIRNAERLVAAQDIAEPEVMLEVEVLEIGANRLMDLGLRYPNSFAVGVAGGGTTPPTPGVITLEEWRSHDAGLVRFTFTDPLFLLSLRQEDGSTNLLANPRIRVKNREKASIHIGDRVPVITTTAAAAGTFVSQSVSYLDVGLKLEVEPLIYLDDDVGIKVGLEVSSITNTVKSDDGNTLTYQIGTRTANTVLRMHDGETQVLGGLISDEDRRNASRVPGLGDLPVLGRLFSLHSDNTAKTEVTLLITPHIVRSLARPDARTVEFTAGTEPPLGAAPLGSFGAPTPFVPTPAAPSTPPAAPATPTTGSTMSPFGGMQQAPR
jgi:general secretion pathway protein D